MTLVPSDNDHDAAADATIRACLDLSTPKSFFLYAGAGSGKTRSLVGAVADLLGREGRRLTLTGQRVAVITYTNAACDEIKQRLAFDARVEVSTIHAFAWSLMRGYDADIRTWLSSNLELEIAALEEEARKGKPGTKTARQRERTIERKRERRSGLDGIARFVYSPTGDNGTRDSLNHAEVIAMTAALLVERPSLRRQVVARHPVLLVDESQDTTAPLMDALLALQQHHPEEVSLGLFGDTMQRIYMDGKSDLDSAVPTDWQRPRKAMNHRCPARIVRLVNAVRADDDRQVQLARSDASAGHVRLFLVPQTEADPSTVEGMIAVRMAEAAGDPSWREGGQAVKTLTLEHMMAARRLGFATLFEPLNRLKAKRTSFLDGSDPGLQFFARDILPLAKALRDDDRFAAAACIRRRSPLLSRQRLLDAGDQQREVLAETKAACEELSTLLSAADAPSLYTVLRHVAAANLFAVPDVLQPFVPNDEEDDDNGDELTEQGAWRQALDAPFAEIEAYDDYVRGLSRFDTHQGVKGLEFPRVMVVLSDEEARGFSFSYDKLFGLKPQTLADRKNDAAGLETGVDRTRRLFYVTCSRARESLAIVYYTKDCDAARRALLQRKWFDDTEIEIVSSTQPAL